MLFTLLGWAWRAGFFGALLALAFCPVVFGVLTGALALQVFGSLECARDRHWRAFYCDAPGAEPPWPRTLLQAAEVLGRSVIIALVTFLLFLGTDRSRLGWFALAFAASVLLGALMLGWIERGARVHGERWGYLRLSLWLGVVFSVLILPVPGLTGWEVLRDLTLNQTTGLTLAETGELVYGATSLLNALISAGLRDALGQGFGTLASLVISTNLIYGLPIVLYAVLYRRLDRAWATWGARRCHPAD